MTPSDIAIQTDTEPVNRATIPTTGIIKWVEPPETQQSEIDEISPRFRHQHEYFDQLQEAVRGIAALIESEMSAAEILRKAKEEVKKIEAESYDVVREYLGEEVTDQMQKINDDLDDLAALVSGIEASLAGFSPMVEDEDLDQAEEAAA